MSSSGIDCLCCKGLFGSTDLGRPASGEWIALASFASGNVGSEGVSC
jgi:hypothetical protein